MKLSGHTVLITGAGTGMGLEAAKQFSRRGNRVIMVARNEERLRDEASQLKDAVAYACDITDPDEVEAMLTYVDENYPEQDVVLLNAGLTHTYRLFSGEDTFGNAESEMRTNYLSAVRLIDAFVPRIGRQPDPALIITTSGAAFGPDITNPTYSATKAALHSLTQSVRLQLERDGSHIKVFEFMAPPVDTPFAAAVQSDIKMSAEEAIDHLIDGLKSDEFEMHVGITASTFKLLSKGSDAAVRAVNAATSG